VVAGVAVAEARPDASRLGQELHQPRLDVGRGAFAILLLALRAHDARVEAGPPLAAHGDKHPRQRTRPLVVFFLEGGVQHAALQPDQGGVGRIVARQLAPSARGRRPVAPLVDVEALVQEQ
jgi:hypothetical protein